MPKGREKGLSGDSIKLMSGTVNLCYPDGEKTCFACCPPIRAAQYEHIQYESIVKRFLRENTAAFKADERDIRPITGFSCWALGFLDPECRLIGCLLHPARHHETDLRFRVDFGEKCRREICPEAKIFESLNSEAKGFWLTLTKDMNSFSYSSRIENPLFKILNWGPHILGLAAGEGKKAVSGCSSILEVFPFFNTKIAPRASAYPAERILLRNGAAGLLRDSYFKGRFEGFLGNHISVFKKAASFPSISERPHVNLLPMERSFRDFIRLSLDIQRMDSPEAEDLKSRIDEEIDIFARELGLEDFVRNTSF
jgi:hypothetical protein